MLGPALAPRAVNPAYLKGAPYFIIILKMGGSGGLLYTLSCESMTGDSYLKVIPRLLPNYWRGSCAFLAIMDGAGQWIAKFGHVRDAVKKRLERDEPLLGAVSPRSTQNSSRFRFCLILINSCICLSILTSSATYMLFPMTIIPQTEWIYHVIAWAIGLTFWVSNLFVLVVFKYEKLIRNMRPLTDDIREILNYNPFNRMALILLLVCSTITTSGRNFYSTRSLLVNVFSFPQGTALLYTTELLTFFSIPMTWNMNVRETMGSYKYLVNWLSVADSTLTCPTLTCPTLTCSTFWKFLKTVVIICDGLGQLMLNISGTNTLLVSMGLNHKWAKFLLTLFSASLATLQYTTFNYIPKERDHSPLPKYDSTTNAAPPGGTPPPTTWRQSFADDASHANPSEADVRPTSTTTP